MAGSSPVTRVPINLADDQYDLPEKIQISDPGRVGVGFTPLKFPLDMEGQYAK